MSKLAKALVRQMSGMLACFAVCVIALAAVSVWSSSITTTVSDNLYRDKIQTIQASSALADGLRAADDGANSLLAETATSARKASATSLFGSTVPSVEEQISALRRQGTINTSRERDLVSTVTRSWTTMRALFVPALEVDQTDGLSVDHLRAQLQVAFAPIVPAITSLRAEELREGAEAAARGHDAWLHSLIVIITSAAASLAITAMVVIRGGRRFVRSAVAGEAAQQEYAQAMQLAGSEDDAYRLITRHLTRTVGGTRAVVLNRNNSADRLEAMTAVPADLPLALDGADPRSCIAIRTAQAYARVATDDPLLACSVCSACPRSSLCTPITVMGEVIGTVFVDAETVIDSHHEARVLQTVAESAPMLANLRNLAIAELRAATDALTGLPNKRALVHTLKRMVAQASRTMTPLAVLSLDLDHFKQINDEYGHPRGDDVLAAVGATLSAAVREADFAGRNGGEEFLVLLAATDCDGALAIAERIASAIRQIFVVEVERPITASIGIAVFPDDATDAARLERAADRALYTAKTNGRDRVEIAAKLALQPAAT